MSQTLFEKLQLTDEKNLLIQGIPSSIEKQFVKLSFAKNVTPLLRAKKIDFALIFALNQRQLGQILSEVLPALHEQAKLWVAYPKLASKIASDLNRDCSWNCLCEDGFEIVRSIALDHVWTALRFKKSEHIPAALARAAAQVATPNTAGTAPEAESMEVVALAEVPGRKRTLTPPEDLEQLFTLHPRAKVFFDGLSFTNKKEYIVWITGAKKEDTRKRRLDATLEKLKAGKKNPSEK
jgi:hypothetical protein